jgi:plasmid stabilization system protein ParE
MLPIIFHPEAVIEANVAVEWYELQQPGLGDRFENDLLRTAQRIQENPHIYAVEKHGEIFASLRDFPYSLIYKFYADQIWVSCVSHHKRRPGYWRKRNPN